MKNNLQKNKFNYFETYFRNMPRKKYGFLFCFFSFLNLYLCQLYPIFTFSNGLVFQQTAFHNMKPGKTNALIRKHVSMDLPMPTKFPNIGCDATQAQVIARVLTVRVGRQTIQVLLLAFFSFKLSFEFKLLYLT